MSDLTHTEAREAFIKFCDCVGPKAECSVVILSKGGPGALWCNFYPEGMTRCSDMHVSADTYTGLLANLENLWAKHSENFAAQTIRAMALEIIVQTADQGQCTDAALRAKFSAREVEAYGAKACAQASEMAANGPFVIVVLEGANAA